MTEQPYAFVSPHGCEKSKIGTLQILQTQLQIQLLVCLNGYLPGGRKVGIPLAIFGIFQYV